MWLLAVHAIVPYAAEHYWTGLGKRQHHIETVIEILEKTESAIANVDMIYSLRAKKSSAFQAKSEIVTGTALWISYLSASAGEAHGDSRMTKLVLPHPWWCWMQSVNEIWSSVTPLCNDAVTCQIKGTAASMNPTLLSLLFCFLDRDCVFSRSLSISARTTHNVFFHLNTFYLSILIFSKYLYLSTPPYIYERESI